nr:MAG TPA: DNA N-6-adenine-methyltransferase [Bacteriophage sp.]
MDGTAGCTGGRTWIKNFGWVQIGGSKDGDRMEQMTLFNDNPAYAAFVEKFNPRKTTDDCYTPPLVYETVKGWACKEYDIDPDNIVRPFYPGGDYERYDYPDGCTVLDNPPFSILSRIYRFYLERGIRFFLFAPSLTALSGKDTCMEMTHIICDADITYANGAVVRTAFVTNLGGDVVARTAPDLHRIIEAAMVKIRQEARKEQPKYQYPEHILTAAMLQKYSKYGIDFEVRRGDCVSISKLDAQAERGKTIFGSGLLLSDAKAAERAAAERAAAERAHAYVWELSDREREIVRGLG